MKKSSYLLTFLLIIIALWLPTTVKSSLSRELILSIDGKKRVINASQFSATIIDALDCSKLQISDRLSLRGQFFVNSPQIDRNTGKIAVAVVLSECVETQQTAIFIIDRNSTTLLQVPGSRRLKNPNQTYALNAIAGLQYLNGNLLAINTDASGTQSLLAFKPSGKYAGCIELAKGEGRNLCPQP
ncbi:MAG: hypothetical protein QNJ38_11495 [Prochloraceae cyanobacterium]|nr:hypothetical protein [Prochloraceae cyanobacterium]